MQGCEPMRLRQFLHQSPLQLLSNGKVRMMLKYTHNHMYIHIGTYAACIHMKIEKILSLMLCQTTQNIHGHHHSPPNTYSLVNPLGYFCIF